MIAPRREQNKQTEETDSGGKASVAETGMLGKGRKRPSTVAKYFKERVIMSLFFSTFPYTKQNNRQRGKTIDREIEKDMIASLGQPQDPPNKLIVTPTGKW